MFHADADIPLVRTLVPRRALLYTILALSSVPATAADYFVDRGAGVNSADCGLTRQQPCRSIGWTVGRRIGPGDHVYLLGDTAFRPRGITLAHDVTFHGRGSGETVLDAGGEDRHFRVDLGATVRFEEVSLVNGDAPGSGGGSIDVVDGELHVEGVTFENNAAHDGGAVRVQLGRMASRHSRYLANSVELDGGAIYCDPDTCDGLLIVDSVFTGNEAFDDGGAVMSGGESTIRRSDFLENVSGGFGGAVASDGWLELGASQFLRNSAAYGGAVALATEGGDLRRNSFVDNDAAGTGGALHVVSGTDEVAVVNSTFSGNSADVAGALQGDALVAFSTFVDNEAMPGRAQVIVSTQQLELRYSLLTSRRGNGSPECEGVVVGADNLTDTSSCGGWFGAHNNEALNDLGYARGRTLVHSLDSFSNAIGAVAEADCRAPHGPNEVDQHGRPRPAAGSGCDIGAYERQL